MIRAKPLCVPMGEVTMSDHIFSMTGAGLVMLGAALALPSRLGGPVMLAAAVAGLIGPVVYSYLTWKREQGR